VLRATRHDVSDRAGMAKGRTGLGPLRDARLRARREPADAADPAPGRPAGGRVDVRSRRSAAGAGGHPYRRATRSVVHTVINRTRVPRVAFFTDSYREANGIARLSRAFEAVARRRGWPWLTIHGGDATRLIDNGASKRLELRRSAAAFRLEHDLAFDPLLWRHYRRVAALLHEFGADVVHFTGPSDVGQ